jgi:8-oxo-dGTP pyrophosphatase MutT (NUDIX family)
MGITAINMLEFEILAQGLYRPEQLVISYNPALTMPKSPETAAWMDTLWEQKLTEARARQRMLFDTPLFRLIEVGAHADGTLSLLLGNTSYKEYVTTRVPEFANKHARAELSNPLSVCSVVETSDGHILLDKREGVDVYVGRYHVIGGFFERDLDMGQRPDPFGAIQRELREETGVQLADISTQCCLGAVYDVATPHGELVFLTQLHITLAEVHTREPEDREIKHLHSLFITADSLRDFILQHHGNISATGEPNLLLYGQLKFGLAWFEDVLARLH